EIYKSSYNTAGEIGHTIIDVNGPQCKCGNKGCLEAFASESAILDQVNKELESNRESILREWVNDGVNKLSIKMVFQAAKEGDLLAATILEESGNSLGIAVANLINILKPSKIILEGHLFEEGDFVLSPLKKMINKYTFNRSQDEITVVCSKLGKTGMVLGAVTLILRKMFKADDSY
ncbi:MAG TPA: ROK family protein, partial [Neobacillus sp.]